jgi:uncharacterized protein (TIGR00661 family)
MCKGKNILFGVLNWGLGHATRSIPVIRQLVDEGNRVIIASDGAALKLLQDEFPGFIFEPLPAYHIRYSKYSFLLPLKLLGQTPHIWQTIRKEKEIVRQLVTKHRIDMLISDNRFGFWHPQVYSVYITHQLRVLSGITTPLTTWLHGLVYRKFDEIRVPDNAGENNLSGKLGHLKRLDKKVKYTGTVSRLIKEKLPLKYDLLAILSGPEPQRSLLEQKLIKQMQQLSVRCAIVQGKVNGKQLKRKEGNIDIYNYATSRKLQNLINTSELVIARSGYTSVMDLFALEKKVLWVPTPGQFEQEYLAQYLQDKYQFSYQKQKKLNIQSVL